MGLLAAETGVRCITSLVQRRRCDNQGGTLSLHSETDGIRAMRHGDLVSMDSLCLHLSFLFSNDAVLVIASVLWVSTLCHSVLV